MWWVVFWWNVEVSEELIAPTFTAVVQIKSVACFSFVACLAYSTLKIEAVSYSETLLNYYQIIRHHTPEDSSFHLQS
jgi:hypothetical protein